MSIDKCTLRDYTLFTELAVREFIQECGLTEDEKMQLENKIDKVLDGAYYVPDIVHTIADLLCKVYNTDESNEILKEIAKRSLLNGTTEKLFTGCLDKIDRFVLLCALLDFIEQENGSLKEFIEIWQKSYLHRMT